MLQFLRRFVVVIAGLSALCSLGEAAEGANEPIAGIGPVGPIEKLHGDFKFVEGPAADREGNVYFSDIPASLIYRVDIQDKLSVFRTESNSSNGLMFNAQGELVACEMGGRVTAISEDGKTARPLAEQFEGKRFNAPNDLVVDKSGGVYFTDPHFRAPMPLPQGVMGVYYISAEGEVTRLIDDLKAPNGVILSPDEQTLYVIPTLQAEMMAYPVEKQGKIGKGKVFCTLKQPPKETGKGGDGLTVDTQGNLYITSALGLQVFDAKGAALGIIAFPEQPANVTFGGPERKKLYVTARTGLYVAPMEAVGHVFEGK